MWCSINLGCCRVQRKSQEPNVKFLGWQIVSPNFSWIQVHQTKKCIGNWKPYQNGKIHFHHFWAWSLFSSFPLNPIWQKSLLKVNSSEGFDMEMVGCTKAAFLRKAGPSFVLRWPEGETRCARGGKLEDSPSLLRTRVLGLLLLSLLRRYSLLMLLAAFLCVVLLQSNQ